MNLIDMIVAALISVFQLPLLIFSLPLALFSGLLF